MKIIKIGEDKVSLDKFQDWKDAYLNDYSGPTANSMFFSETFEIGEDEVEVEYVVYTKYFSRSEAADLVRDGYRDAKKIFDEISFVQEKWEVTSSYGYEVELSDEAKKKLDELHDWAADNNSEFDIQAIELLMEEIICDEELEK